MKTYRQEHEPYDNKTKLFIVILALITAMLLLMLGRATAQVPETALSWNGNDLNITVKKNVPQKPLVSIRTTTQAEPLDMDTIYTVTIQVTYFPFKPLPADSIKILGTSFFETSGILDAKNKNGVVIENDSILGFINPGDNWKYANIDLSGKTELFLEYASNSSTIQTLDIKANGEIVGTMTGFNTGGWTIFKRVRIQLQPVIIFSPQLYTLEFVIRGNPDAATYFGNIKNFVLK